MSIDLFQKVNFKSHAGLDLSWKIECDAVSNDEWDCLALMIMKYQREPFSKAYGIPRGGLKLANSLNKYATGDEGHFPLICDDVFTTGTSMIEFIKKEFPKFLGAMGYRWVIFARKKSNVHPYHVRALFTMPEVIYEYEV